MYAGLVGFWPNTSGPEASQCARIIGPGSCRMQPAHDQFSTCRLGSVLPKTAWIILCKTSPDPVWFWLTVSFGPNGSGLEASLCARIIGLASGHCFAANTDWMLITESDLACLLGYRQKNNCIWCRFVKFLSSSRDTCLQYCYCNWHALVLSFLVFWVLLCLPF